MIIDRTRDRRAAMLVLVPALLSIVAILHHPVVQVRPEPSMADVIAGVQRIAVPNAAFHAFVMILLGAQAIGLSSVAERLGLSRLTVRAGAFFYATSVLLLFVATVVDGFATPLLGHGCSGDAARCASAFAASLAIVFGLIQAFTKVGLAAQALGLVFLSLAATDLRPGWLRAVALAGLALAVVPIALLATSDASIDPHRLAALLAFECAWSVGAAVCLWTGALARGRDANGRPDT